MFINILQCYTFISSCFVNANRFSRTEYDIDIIEIVMGENSFTV